jgi:N-acetylmuramic acid 6-phosphate etherase
LFYIGAGTSGRLGIVDASECPPSFGVPYGLVIGLIAGGDKAITQAVEFAEDSTDKGWNDLQKHFISDKDVVVGLAASGTTPYVISALKECRKHGIITGSISCNPNSPVSVRSRFPGGSSGGTRIHYRQYPHEKRHGTKIGAEYDLQFCNDPIGPGGG